MESAFIHQLIHSKGWSHAAANLEISSRTSVGWRSFCAEVNEKWGPCVDRATEDVLTYIASYLAFRTCRRHSCDQCVLAFTKDLYGLALYTLHSPHTVCAS